MRFRFPRLLSLAILLLSIVSTQAATLPLWPGPPPNHKSSDLVEKTVADERIIRISQVQTPTIDVHLPARANANGQAVVICPGGGYGILAYDWEGTDIANRLNADGIAAIVLKYRLPEDASNVIPHLTPLLDAQRALRLTRHRAADWNIDPAQVGIMGFSAGGHLASTAGTHFDAGNPAAPDPVERLSSRPDFLILMYPVVSFDPAVGHSGSRRNLLGEQDSPELVAYYSNELHVTAETPPTFLVHSIDDKSVPIRNSLRFYEALLDHGVSAEMHLYPHGGHGFGLALNQGHLSGWSDRLVEWLSSLKPAK